jgi:pimeloyl-ACP methyl ester carboxylesterase
MISDADFNQIFSHHTAEVNNVRLHYVTGGKGEAVVLLHGWPETWYEWRHVMPVLAERYTVIAPDMRGLGDSSKPASGYDKQTVAEDIYQLVSQLGHQRILLVGHDIGAGVAYALAAAHLEAVRRLVIMEFTLAGFGLEQAMDVAKGGLWHFGFHMALDIPEALVTGREREYLSLFYGRDAYNPAAITPADIDEFVRCYSAPGALRAGFEYYRAFPMDAEHNKEKAKQKLTMPVLAIGGASSLKERPMQSLQHVALDVRGVVVDRAGHRLVRLSPDR